MAELMEEVQDFLTEDEFVDESLLEKEEPEKKTAAKVTTGSTAAKKTAAKKKPVKRTANGKKIGRPSREELARREKEKKKMAAAELAATIQSLPPIYKCTRCGKISTQGAGNFFMINNNVAFEGNDGRSNICSECCEKFLKEYKDTYGDEKVAVMLTCMNLGIYFSEFCYDRMHEREMQDPTNEFSMGKYIRQLSGPQYHKQTFLSYVISLFKDNQKGMMPIQDTRERLEDGWKAADKRNKMMCLKEVGYDCFDDKMYSSEDRRLMFNSLAQYLSSEDITEDKHRRDAVINIVKTDMQVEFLDRELNRESRSVSPDFGKIDRLIGAKRNLNTVISTIAKENAISTSGSGRRQSSSTALTAIMKEMLDNGVMESKTNLTSVKMSATFRRIADISAHSLNAELNITGDEYASMVAKQADTIRELQEKNELLQEELRMMTLRVHDEESGGKKWTQHTVEIDETGIPIIDEKLFEEQMAQEQKEWEENNQC